MTSDVSTVNDTVARHEREIRRLQEQVRDLETGYAREKLEAEIEHHIAELEAEIKFQELQEAMAQEEDQKHRKHHILRMF